MQEDCRHGPRFGKEVCIDANRTEIDLVYQMTNKPEVTMRLAGILIVAIICVAGGATVAEVTPPNIVLILTDDQGWSQVSQAMDPRNRARRTSRHRA